MIIGTQRWPRPLCRRLRTAIGYAHASAPLPGGRPLVKPIQDGSPAASSRRLAACAAGQIPRLAWFRRSSRPCWPGLVRLAAG
jgi:hypothetical protein